MTFIVPPRQYETTPCAQTPVGACLAHPSDPTHCARCGKVVDHARTRLALAVSDMAQPWWRR